MTALAAAGAALLGGRLQHATPVGGGNLSQILRIGLADGREAIVKGGPAPRTEAAMLAAIAAAGAPAPRVLAVDDTALVLAVVPGRSGPEGAWHSLGAVLAGLHAVRGAHYGWDTDYAFGPVAIENGPAADWPAFWAERRLAVHLPHLPLDLARRVERLAADLSNHLPAQPKAALLHGDLWGGNLLTEHGRVTALIDPACYFGHAEVDLAMLALFDQPGPDFRAAYGSPAPGETARRPLYQLWPALVHLRLFGAGYRALVERLLGAAGV
jgi:fructosamine-3-kinase